jgi:hypothetical protein
MGIALVGEFDIEYGADTPPIVSAIPPYARPPSHRPYPLSCLMPSC